MCTLGYNTPDVEEEIPKSVGRRRQKHELGRASLSRETYKQYSKFVKMQMTNWCTFERFKDIQAGWSFSQN